LPRDVQKVFVSATNQPKSNSIARKMCGEIIEIHAGSNKISKKIEHIFIIVRENEKLAELLKFFLKTKPRKSIVFAHKNETAKIIAKHLSANGIAAVEIHGARDKHQRVQTIAGFRKGKIKVLVASDIAARGLDFNDITHIINFDVPGQSKNYLHRAGRTGRMGKKGCCVSLLSPEEKNVPKRFEKELKIQTKLL
jgi:superfamily II DNA/RNA helicase